MNPVTEDIKDMLEADSSLGLALADNLFIGFEPPTPDNCVTLFDTTGRQAALNMDGSEYRYNSLQVRGRNIDYLNGYSEMESIYNFLQGKSHETWNGTVYQLIIATSDIGILDWDENNRVRFSINFEVQRTQ